MNQNLVGSILGRSSIKIAQKKRRAIKEEYLSFCFEVT
jgi:hypothetical protein